jgi:hypothetical protein
LLEKKAAQQSSDQNSTPAQSIGWHMGENLSTSNSSSNSKFEPNVLQVYAAYHSGLANGTSVKLNVTHATTAREVVDLVRNLIIN